MCDIFCTRHKSAPLAEVVHKTPSSSREYLACTGRFGFQKEMNALSSLRTAGNAGETDAVTSLLRGTQEVERRIQQPIHRWWWLWRRDVREGWGLLGRFQVTHSCRPCSLINGQCVH